MILFVDACVRTHSRTKRLAEALLAKLNEEAVHINTHLKDSPRACDKMEATDNEKNNSSLWK